MNGKVLKVAEVDLKFGVKARMVNIFGLFKYKPNNNIYVIYADQNSPYNFIDYGGSHVKNNSILSMSSDPKKTEEIIKEYIYKITNQQPLDNFELISLKEIEEIEIIASNKLELKKEVFKTLEELTIPKPESTESTTIKEKKKKKRSPLKVLFLILIIFLAITLAFLYYTNLNKEEPISKIIVCTKTYEHEDLEYITVDEEQTFNFNNSDNLTSVNINQLFKFATEESYQDFINRGLFYRYMPSEDTEGGWNQDDENQTFQIITKERPNTAYTKPTNYEDVISYYENKGYNCNESIEK